MIGGPPEGGRGPRRGSFSHETWRKWLARDDMTDGDKRRARGIQEMREMCQKHEESFSAKELPDR